MLMSLISDDRPRSRILTAILLLIFLGLALAPFLFPGVRALETAAKIAIFIVLAASYDLLLGYTGVVSFAHTMFFGMGAYGVGLASQHIGRSFGALALGSLAGAVLAAALAFLIALFSLRVRAIFFAMITLAVASAVAVLVSQLSWLTGGEDGFTFQIPAELGPGRRYGEFMGVRITGKIVSYYLVFFSCLALFLFLLRVVNSPFGRVLQAIRENDFRAEAVGYRVVWHRIVATCVSAAVAALAGSLFAIWLRYVGPDVTLSFSLMLDILLMVVIGGMGTMYGAAIGATILVLAQTYLQNLMGSAASATSAIPMLERLLSPDRWLLWLGVLFILSVYFFPTGIVGRLRGNR